MESLPFFFRQSPLLVLCIRCLIISYRSFSFTGACTSNRAYPDFVFVYIYHLGGMMQSTRFYISGLAAIVFLALLLLLAQTLPNEPRPNAIRPVRWSAQRDMGENQKSNRKTWKGTDWSPFAYVQYVTNLPYLCNSVMLFESLHSLGCKPDRLMMYPSGSSLDDNSTESRLLTKARDEFKVKLKPIDVQRRTDTQDRKLLKGHDLQRY